MSLDARQVGMRWDTESMLFSGDILEVVELLTRSFFPSPDHDRALKNPRWGFRSLPHIFPTEFEIRRWSTKSTLYPHMSPIRHEDDQSITHQKRRRLSNEDVLYPKCRKLLKKSQEVASRSPNLSTLPTELIGVIFENLRMDDALSLAVVAQRFWDIGWCYMEKKLMDSMAP